MTGDGMKPTARGSTVLTRQIACLGVTAALAMGLGGCGTALTQSAPHPGRPEIASGRLESDRVRSGCPIKLRLVFRDVEGNVARALASWSYSGRPESATRRCTSCRTVSPPWRSILHR
jgi:uncharacterized protein YceK